jgi:hypothetical protein
MPITGKQAEARARSPAPKLTGQLQENLILQNRGTGGQGSSSCCLYDLGSPSNPVPPEKR